MGSNRAPVAPKTPTPARAGTGTSEWFGTILTHLFAFGTALFVLIDHPFPRSAAVLQGLIPTLALVASAVVQIGYSLSRGKVKAAVIEALAVVGDAETLWHALFPDRQMPVAVAQSGEATRAANSAYASMGITGTTKSTG